MSQINSYFSDLYLFVEERLDDLWACVPVSTAPIMRPNLWTGNRGPFKNVPHPGPG